MRNCPAIAVLILGWALAGCSSPPDRVPVAGLEVPPAWAAGSPAGRVADHWWTTFGSAQLTALVGEALQNNDDLGVALARIDAAVAQARIAGADGLPALDLALSAQRRQQVFVGLPIPGREGEPLQSLSTSLGLAFNISWELDVWGRIRAGQSAALAEVQATEQDFRAGLLSVAGQTVKAWLGVLEAERQLALAQATAKSFAVTAAQVRRRYDRGLRSALDLRLALNNASVAKALVARRERERAAQIRQLEVILGRYPAGALAVDEALPGMPPAVPAGLPSALLERRPDLAAAERRVAGLLQRVREARAALLPRVSLTASGGRTSTELEDLISSQFSMWSLGANLAQPILQGGRLWANLEWSEARAREAVAAYRQTALRAFAEVETTLSSAGWLEQREADIEESVRQSRAALRLAEERYRAGLIDFVTLMESQRSAYSAESELITVHRQRLDNRVDLHLALGGGFDAASLPQVVRKESTP